MTDILVLLLFTPRRDRGTRAPGRARRRRVAGASARLRTVPPLAARRGDARASHTAGRCALREPRRPARMRRPAARQPRALRQHGGAADGFFRRHLEPLAHGRAGRQAGRRIHLGQHDAWRPGNDPTVHAAAAAAPRHADRRPAVHGARLVVDRPAAARPMARAAWCPMARQPRADGCASGNSPRPSAGASPSSRCGSPRRADERRARGAHCGSPLVAWTLLVASIVVWPFAAPASACLTAIRVRTAAAAPARTGARIGDARCAGRR